MRTLAAFAALMVLSAPAFSLELSFFGTRPDALTGRELKVETGAVPGTPVVLDFKDPATAVLRPAKDDEESSAQHPVYLFEWTAKDKSSARLFPITPAAELDRVRKQNDTTTAAGEGKALEDSIVMAYLNKGAVLRTCVSKSPELPEALTFYVTLTPGSSVATAVVVPEGSVAECVLTASDRGAYPAVKAPVTARMRIGLSH